MQIDALELFATDLAALHAFYADGFGLPATLAADHLTIQIGTTRLTFAQAPAGWTGRYHFAFNIPKDQFAAAKAWLAERVALATDANGQDTFYSDSWDADNLYFYDPAGNIAELIARRTLDATATAPFGPASLLNVSELGIAAPDVPAAVADLTARLGIATYSEPSDTFTPIGDEHGLFIIVRAGRIWYPNTGISAVPLPFEADIRNAQGTSLHVTSTSSGITIRPVRE